MYSKITSAVVYGIEGLLVEIEVRISKGLPSYQIVGLPDKIIRESKERVRSALESLSIQLPPKRVTMNLVPAEIPKDGSQLDLPMAIGLLCSMGVVNAENACEIAYFGELSLDGRLITVPGVLSMVEAVAKSGIRKVVVPKSIVAEVSIVPDIKCFGAASLEEVVKLLEMKDIEASFTRFEYKIQDRSFESNAADFSEVIGQEVAKRALMIAASGFHNILVTGPPGCGKSMMMHAFENVLPSLELEEALEVKRIKSVFSKVDTGVLSLRRPFRKPHHNITAVAMMGGGTKPLPGEITRAHRGVLFLDELPEYRREAIESLRQALEDGFVDISRINGQMRMPAKILLAATMNPCKCGFLHSMEKECTCSYRETQAYLSKLSGPILDRIDILLEVQSVNMSQQQNKQLSSSEMKEQIERAYLVQKQRFRNSSIQFNSEMTKAHIVECAKLSTGAEHMLIESAKAFKFTKRVQEKLIRIARTIADLEESEYIDAIHAAEAVQYRMAENRLRGNRF